MEHIRRDFSPKSIFHSINHFADYSNANRAQRYLSLSCKDSIDYVQRLGLLNQFTGHNGCVNSINWNSKNDSILSAGDDRILRITNIFNEYTAFSYQSLHAANIFSARFIPQSDDLAMVSCSSDGVVYYTQLKAPYIRTQGVASNYNYNSLALGRFDCHKPCSVYDVATLPYEPQCFMTCGDDGTVRFIDLRCISQCLGRDCMKNVYLACKAPFTAFDVGPINNIALAVVGSDSIVRLYDRRKLSSYKPGCASLSNGLSETVVVKSFPIPEPKNRAYRATACRFSPDENELLVSYSTDHLYLYDLKHEGFDLKKLLATGCYLKKSPTYPGNRRIRLRGDWTDTGPDALSAEDIERINSAPNHRTSQIDVVRRFVNNISNLSHDPVISDRLMGNTSIDYESVVSPTTSMVTPRPQEVNQIGNLWCNAIRRTIENFSPQNNTAITLNTSEIEALMKLLSKKDYVRMKYSGHRNSRTIIKGVCFWGNNFIMSGSDCGHIFIWERQTGRVVNTILADQHVVNRVLPHPDLPYILSSGIDYDIKLWAPIELESSVDQEYIDNLMRRNSIMLEESLNTITIPVPLLIQLVRSLRLPIPPQSNPSNAEQNNPET